MTLKQLFDEYYLDTKEGEKLVKTFPDFYAYMEEIEVVPWDKELEKAFDKNPEIIDTIEYITMMLRNGMITKEEADRMFESLPKDYSSKVMGVAFIEDKTVSFRDDNIPRLNVLIHEAGHIYFKENDLYWSVDFAGGEYLMYLILNDYIKGNEETVRDFMKTLRLIDENPEKANDILNRFAEDFFSKINCPNCPEKKNALALMVSAGTLPSKLIDIDNPPDDMSREDMRSFLVNMLEGIRWKDGWWSSVGNKFFEDMPRCLLDMELSKLKPR